MTFRTTIAQTGNNTGLLVPAEIVTALGAGEQPQVHVTLNGHTYRSSIASMGGRFLISLSADNRAKAGAAGGDEAATRQRRIDTAIAQLVGDSSAAPSGG